VLPDLQTLGAPGVYALMAALVFAESGLLVGFFLPGDTVLFAAGLWSADAASGLSLPVLVAVVLVAAITGDAVGYAYGRAGGAALLRRRGRVLTAHNVARAQAFADRYGALAVVAARWVPWVRVFVPVLAGVARMPYGRFLVANITGALTWGAGLVVLGHLAASTPGLAPGAAALAGAVVAGSLGWAVLRLYRQRSARRR